jgi:hypothetical protein
MKRINVSIRSSRIYAYVFGILVFAIGIVLDSALIGAGTPRPMTLLFDDVLTGVAAGFALWLTLRNEAKRRLEEDHRLKVLDEMNHHVRNALQVMVLCSYTIGGEKGEELLQAARKIQWSLTEVLPKVNFEPLPPPPSGEGFSYVPPEKPSRKFS